MESKTQGLAKLLREHRRCRAVNYGGDYECVCGEPVSSNSHHVMSQHQADKILEYLASNNEPTSRSWTLATLRANFEWGGSIHHDPAEFDRVIEQVRAEAFKKGFDHAHNQHTAHQAKRSLPYPPIAYENPHKATS